jgi:5-methylcytosine-specific restriction protein A
MPNRPKVHQARLPAPRQRVPDPRPSAAKRGYDRRWQKARAAFLRQNPLCAECLQKGAVVPAKVVDHITPVVGGQSDPSFWVAEGWNSLCIRCHAAKSAREKKGA